MISIMFAQNGVWAIDGGLSIDPTPDPSPSFPSDFLYPAWSQYPANGA